VKLAVADRLVFAKVRAKLGGALETIVVGGARLDPEVGRFFHGMGIAVCEGWGLTETCAPATLNRPDDLRFGTVGRALPGVELRLDDDGEVLVRGPGLFRGYWRDPDATAAAFTPDGFFRTGDIGVIEDGRLSIVDRKKEILVTSGGKNIPPVNIEKKLEGGVIGQAVVIGNDRPYLVALLAPDPDTAKGLSETELRARADARVRDVNATLPPFEQVKRWALLPGPLTVEDGLLTPTLKLRRKPIEARWRDLIEGLYR
jgi:long-chain acyl-CoA synthetase